MNRRGAETQRKTYLRLDAPVTRTAKLVGLHKRSVAGDVAWNGVALYRPTAIWVGATLAANNAKDAKSCFQ